MRGIAKTLAAFALSGLCVTSVAAQTADEEASLRALQAEQFREMFDKPDDLELMFTYAMTSLRLEDYEAAISTFDRMLIYNPDQPRIRLEMGAAYFRIGSYPIARFYFDQVLADEATPDDLRPRVQAFIDQIDKRTSRSILTGAVGFDIVHTTNANNGPDSRLIDFRGALVRLSGAQVTSQTDQGVALSAAFTHIYDMGGAHGDEWRTDVALYAIRYSDTPAGSAEVAVVRTGPRLALDDERFGPKIRPYVEVDHVRSSDNSLYSTVGVGAEFTDTLDNKRSVNVDLGVGWRDFHNAGAVDSDGLVLDATASLTYFVDQSFTLIGGVVGGYDGADTRSARSAEAGLRGTAIYSYSSGLEVAGGPWRAILSGEALYREHFATDAVAGVRRKDVDLRVGLSHRAALKGGFQLTAGADYFLRESNSRNFDLDNFTVRVGASYLF